MKRTLSALVVAVCIAACAPIQKTANAEQPLDRTLFAGPGDLVLRVDRARSLRNGVGGADVFGRTTPEGYTEVRFGGIGPDGQVVFRRRDVSIVSNESTLTRPPLSPSRGTASPADTVPIRLAPGEWRLPVSGYLIEVVSATPNALEFVLRRTAVAEHP